MDTTLEPILPGIYLWTDTCNVYVVKEGDSSILVDLGDGSVLDALSGVGISAVEWVLLTHHHREQCGGVGRLRARFPDAGIAAPEAERSLLEDPASFRKMRRTLGDKFSVYGSSYVRPPVDPIAPDRTFSDMDEFTWRSRRFVCVRTGGNSPGSMSYLLMRDGGFWAFSGDVMMDGGRMHTWYDSEWDYGFGSGIVALYNSAVLLSSYRPEVLLPSHGPIIEEPAGQLSEYRRKLETLHRRLTRGYQQGTFGYGDQDPVSSPTGIPHLFRVSEHLFKFKGPDFWPNFHLLLSDSGRALVVDCGLFDEAFLSRTLEAMRAEYGIEGIDAVVITHMHGDHCLNVPFLKETYGAEVWTLDRVAGPIEHPDRYDYAAQICAYGSGIESIAIDRTFRDGETVRWHEYELRFDWMPGQTPFALCLSGRIDGRLAAFTGDNIFGSSSDPGQDGHEGVIAHNGGALEEGYLYAAAYLAELAPDLILGGHSWVIPEPGGMIARFGTAARALRAAYEDLSDEPDYRYLFDPYWVRAEPYRLDLDLSIPSRFELIVRNYLDRDAEHRITVHVPEGLDVEPAVFDVSVPPGGTARVPLDISAAAGAAPGIRIVAFDVSRDGKRYGELFDMIVNVRDDVRRD